MAGLGRVQQKFNAAVMAVMALLATQRKDSARQSVIHMGQPLACKYARSQKPAEVRTIYSRKFCSGKQEIARRARQLAAGTIHVSA